MTIDEADRFVDLACLCYLEDAVARRDEARALLAASPEVVGESVHAAAAAGDLVALRAHLERDPAVAHQSGSPRGWVPLLALCYSRVPQRDASGCLELLLARGADPNAFTTITECRFTALTGVMGEGEAGPIEQAPHPDARALADRLLDAGASPNESQGLYNTHFLRSNAWLELLLARGLTNVAGDLDYLLGQACVQGFAERVKLLLAHGADANGRNAYNKRVHLANALLEGHADIARLLFAAGGNAPELSDDDRFQIAVVANDAAEALRILARHPLANERPDPLIAAARHGRVDSVRLALQLGLPIDGTDREGLTALHHAARAGHVDVARELVQQGASLTIRDPQYDGTPLGHARHFAGRWPGRDEVLAFLEGQAPPK